MSSRSYFYNKHAYRSKSYPGKKRLYGSAYQPGQTTKYQRYGRTMRLDPGYINIPRELPTRQSQLRQLEELRKAGLIPEPVPPSPPTPVPVTYNYIADVFVPSSSNSTLGYIVLNRCISKGYNVSNLIGLSFSGRYHINPGGSSSNIGIMQLFSFYSGTSPPYSYVPVIFKSTGNTAIDILYTVVFMNPEIVVENTKYYVKSPKVRIIMQVNTGSIAVSLLYNTTNNQITPQSTAGVLLNDGEWTTLGDKSLVWVDTPDREAIPYYYFSTVSSANGKVSSSVTQIPYSSSDWSDNSSRPLWIKVSDSELSYANSSFNTGVVMEFAVPQE